MKGSKNAGRRLFGRREIGALSAPAHGDDEDSARSERRSSIDGLSKEELRQQIERDLEEIGLFLTTERPANTNGATETYI